MWFEPLTTWLVALVSSGVPCLNEKTAKKIPAEYWANKELIWKDRVAGMSEKEIIRNVEKGKYYKSTKNIDGNGR